MMPTFCAKCGRYHGCPSPPDPTRPLSWLPSKDSPFISALSDVEIPADPKDDDTEDHLLRAVTAKVAILEAELVDAGALHLANEQSVRNMEKRITELEERLERVRQVRHWFKSWGQLPPGHIARLDAALDWKPA